MGCAVLPSHASCNWGSSHSTRLPCAPNCSKYFGSTTAPVITPLAAVQAAFPDAEVTHDATTAELFTEANAAADAKACEAADVCVLVLGNRMSTKQSQWKKEKVGRAGAGPADEPVGAAGDGQHTCSASPDPSARPRQCPPPPQPASNAYGKLVEGEGYDRTSLKLLDTQEQLWRVRGGWLAAVVAT